MNQKKKIGSKVKTGIEAEEEGDTPMGFTTQINKNCLKTFKKNKKLDKN